MKTKAICHVSVPCERGDDGKDLDGELIIEIKCLLHPDGQLDLLLPPQQHARVVGSHTLEEVSVHGQDSAS